MLQERSGRNGTSARRASGHALSGGRRFPSGERRVLVADDNADMRDYVAALLSTEYEVITASDGVEALDKVQQLLPDLVLTDVMMPNLDGFGLLEKIQADPTTTGIPVVMLSARAGEEGTIEGLEAGADDYLTKPFSARGFSPGSGSTSKHLDRQRRVRSTLERSQQLSTRLSAWRT